MNSTALGAGKLRKIIFADLAHKRFYFEQLKFVRCQDVYHEALIYCLGICGDTRRNIERIYDFETGCVKTECLKEGWQTSGSMRVVRLAFNLYCNGTPSVYDSEDQNEQLEECSSDCCIFNPKGVCLYPLLFGKKAKVTEDGCSSGIVNAEAGKGAEE